MSGYVAIMNQKLWYLFNIFVLELGPFNYHVN